MANLTISKDFYRIDHVLLNSADTYTLFNPLSLSAITYIASSSTVIETCTIYNEAVGKYYVNITPTRYAVDSTYELKWYVIYNSMSPVKTLTTRFRLNLTNISGSVEVEAMSQMFDVEVAYPAYGIEIEIL